MRIVGLVMPGLLVPWARLAQCLPGFLC
jgi:hypothetical protein